MSEKQRFFYTKGELCVFLDLHRDKQVIPDSEASIVLLLFKKDFKSLAGVRED